MSELSLNKYTNGKIYKVINEITEDVYVGSTCTPLCKRMAMHRSHYTNTNFSHRKLYKLMNDIGAEHFQIVLIENNPCREAFYIRQIGTLNMVIEDRTAKEYRETHQEQIKEYMTQSREEKKENKYKENYRV